MKIWTKNSCRLHVLDLRRISRQNLAITPPQVVFFASVFLLLFSAFRWGFHLQILDRSLGFDSYRFFDNFQIDSDLFAIGRLEQNQSSGVFSASFLSGLNGSYSSQFGLGMWMLTLIPSGLGLEVAAGASLMFTLTAAFNAAVSTIFVFIVNKVLSRGAAVVAVIGIMQPWSAAMNHSIYWIIGLKILPALVLATLFSRRTHTDRGSLIAAFFFSILAFLSGYEFATVVMASQIGVISYFSIKHGWNVRKSLLQVLKFVSVVILSFFSALGLHFLQLWNHFGSFQEANSKLIDTVVKNSGANGFQVESWRLESLQSSPIQVLSTYLSMPTLGSPQTYPLVSQLTVALLLVLVIMVGIYRLRFSGSDNLNSELAITVTWFVTLIGPIGWYMLARPHSYVHTHINFALWYFPTVPLGLAIVFDGTAKGLKTLRTRPVLLFWVAFTLSIIVGSFVFSYIRASSS